MDTLLQLTLLLLPGGVLTIAALLYGNRRLAREMAARQQVEANYQELHGRLEKIAEQIPGMIYQYRLHPDGHASCPYASHAIYSLFGLSHQAVREDSALLFQSIHPDDRETVAQSILTSAHTLQRWHLEYRVLLSSGIVRWQLGDAVPERLADGSTLWHGYITDITTNKEAERALQAKEQRLQQHAEEALRKREAHYRLIIAAMSEGVIVRDREGVLLICNPAAERLLGLSRAQLLEPHRIDPRWRASYLDGRTAPLAEWPCQLALQSGQPQHHQQIGIHLPDGHLRWLQVNAEPLFTDEPAALYGVVATFSDITANRAATREIDQQRRTLEAILEQTPVAVMVFSPSGSILLANQEAESLLGDFPSTPLEELGRAYQAFISGSNTPYPPTQMPLVRALQGESCSADDMEIRRSDGSRIRLQITAAPILDQQGKISASVVAFQDITERKRAEAVISASEQRFREMFEYSPVGYQSLDRNGCYLEVNQALCTLLHYRPEQLLGKPFGEFWSPSTQEHFLHAFSCFVEKGSAQQELELIAGDRSLVTVLLQGTIQRDETGLFLRSHCILIDISERKQAELQIEQARQAAEAANQAKSTFIARMNHELRTPLNGILGYAHILRQQALPGSLIEQASTVIEGSGEHLLGLINEILDLAKVEAGRERLERVPVALQGVLDEVMALMRLRAERHNLRLQQQFGALPKQIYADPRRLRQILLNLLGNAIKFTRQGGIILHVTPQQQSAHEVVMRFAVEDSGPGIPADKLHTIFEPFEQLADHRHLPEGTGLGLAICRNLVALMGGRLELMSRHASGGWRTTAEGSELPPAPQQASQTGTLFWFDLRFPIPEESADALVPANAPLRESAQISGIASPPPTLLIVDDIATNRQLLHHLLDPLGCKVLQAVNGVDALQIATAHPLDLLITDIQMPELDGYELIQQFRSPPPDATAPDLRQVKIIVLSASVSRGDEERCLALGADRFLPKPLHAPDLLALLSELAGVEWIYSTPPQVAAVEEYDGPEQAQLEQLWHHTQAGDIDALLAACQALEERHPAFARHIQGLAENLLLEPLGDELKRLLQLAEESEQKIEE